ncbi:myelin protein zero-like 1, isoform CRA_a [Rattus norvegicus]|uniref:Myelin protein zero-like 1, isoform CRA_a n=1 Tax=Rattus norvegicus TaxID=10116 RepID=A6IDH4_RAT|nr:myelin protein zero-like 1, isoform CRA_a [Rattus norvegicus]
MSLCMCKLSCCFSIFFQSHFQLESFRNILSPRDMVCLIEDSAEPLGFPTDVAFSSRAQPV